MRSNVNRKGIALLQYEGQMHAAMTAYAEIAADTARSIAPKATGHFAASIEARHMGFKYARGRLYAHDFKAFWIEHGAGPSPVRGYRPFRARHVLEEAVRLTGMRFEQAYRGGE